mmetsp:Transcript_32376/g.75161  ORF Transcript_32376/g.75161 Transcript_32376/m.75161 type:complete len:226 (+) Transcript_32376:77-754(+)|eukprot:CAMPEP_0171060116 /NCGR_PEP_ID=MMETSP0766_2-20121228/3628_1 /TAXON_ID=439317 /ORGANISM="Gambierdiscus australes, Strain CAWD 149" /LENGTH=225 /DNA_ID=CAMNT_0011515655 /DNA_START=77 /DNA_END=754 /DNA_ORIENTATION=+
MPQGFGALSPVVSVRGARRRSTLATGALAVALLCACASLLPAEDSFVLGARAGPARAVAVARQAEGFSDKSVKKGKDKVVLKPEDLQALHGDKWELVDAVFKGKKAVSPEAIMRARFTALYYKDPGFLAATELDEKANLRERQEQWSVTLGLKEKSILDTLRMIGVEIENLQEADSFEVIEATDSEVEFKIRCRNGKTLHERSTFKEDKKYGYVYSGISEFGQWE